MYGNANITVIMITYGCICICCIKHCLQMYQSVHICTYKQRTVNPQNYTGVNFRESAQYSDYTRKTFVV